MDWLSIHRWIKLETWNRAAELPALNEIDVVLQNRIQDRQKNNKTGLCVAHSLYVAAVLCHVTRKVLLSGGVWDGRGLWRDELRGGK